MPKHDGLKMLGPTKQVNNTKNHPCAPAAKLKGVRPIFQPSAVALKDPSFNTLMDNSTSSTTLYQVHGKIPINERPWNTLPKGCLVQMGAIVGLLRQVTIPNKLAYGYG